MVESIEVGVESEYTTRAILCQERASETLKRVATMVEANNIVIVNCKTGFHRAEAISGVCSAVIGSLSSLRVLHLSIARDQYQDSSHTASVACEWIQQPWCDPREVHARRTEIFRGHSLTRKEAWQAFHDFEESWFSLEVVTGLGGIVMYIMLTGLGVLFVYIIPHSFQHKWSKLKHM